MDLRRRIYGQRPEYCVVVDQLDKVALAYEGDLASVTFDIQAVLHLMLAHNLQYILHSHPYGFGSGYSALDKQVFESWAIVANKSLVHFITDFCTVSRYIVEADGEIHKGRREIGLLESLTSWPYGVKVNAEPYRWF